MGMLGVHGELVWFLVAARLTTVSQLRAVSRGCGASLPAVSPMGTSPFLTLYMPWWSGTSSHSLMAAKIGGMALWRLAARCAEMDSRRRRLLSGVMVTSMAEWPDKVEASI